MYLLIIVKVLRFLLILVINTKGEKSTFLGERKEFSGRQKNGPQRWTHLTLELGTMFPYMIKRVFQMPLKQ